MLNPFEIILSKLEELELKFASIGNPPVLTSSEIIDRLELCKRLAITEPTAIRWEKKGHIPSFRIGSNVRYNWHKVLEALESRKSGKK